LHVWETPKRALFSKLYPKGKEEEKTKAELKAYANKPTGPLVKNLRLIGTGL
jgi:hypothetical protein